MPPGEYEQTLMETYYARAFFRQSLMQSSSAFVQGFRRMMEQLFIKMALLLMDEVGVGKTIQAIGGIETYNYQRAHYESRGCFAGRFG